MLNLHSKIPKKPTIYTLLIKKPNLSSNKTTPTLLSKNYLYKIYTFPKPFLIKQLYSQQYIQLLLRKTP